MKRLSDDDCQKEIQEMRRLYLENDEHHDLDTNLSVKASFFDRFRSLENKKERLRRQLAELEVKRCRATLDKKSAQKVDEKLAIKKALFKKLLDEK